MSEADDDEDEGAPPPQGVYLTRAGHARLSEELRQLLKVERPAVVDIVSWAAGNGDRSENGDYLYGKKRLREIDKRVRFLTRRLRAATVVDPSRVSDRGRVFFGATVTYADEDGNERDVTIVGAEEADFARGEVSLHAPIARALMGARLGDEVRMRGPQGVMVVEIVAVRYPPPEGGADGGSAGPQAA